MTQYTYGGANPGAQLVPDLYINIQAPPSAVLGGAPTDIIGVVGTSNWGPKNSPVSFSDENGGAIAFGPPQNRKYDMMTQVRLAALQGAKNFRAVRATDGNDTAAAATAQTNGLTATAKYTGSRGAGITLTFGAGTAPNTTKVTVAMAGEPPETFDNIAGTANAAWIAVAAAINNGQAGIRGPSNLIVATAGASVVTPVAGTTTLSGGTDGASVAAADLIGLDTGTRTGMYALRSTRCAVFMIADLDTTSTWPTQLAFGLSEQTLPVVVGPASDTIANHTSVINTLGLDNPWIKVLFGDWCYMYDAANKINRRVSPQGAWAGQKVVDGPHNSTLNKPLQGITGTEKSAANRSYSNAELQALSDARTDVLAMDSVGGDYPSFRIGRVATSDPSRWQEPYTTMTNFLATSLGRSKGGLGLFVGRLGTPEEQREARNTIGGFLQGLWDDDLIGNADGTLPYSVDVKPATALGKQKAIVQVQYLSVIEVLEVDLTGGATVVISNPLLGAGA